ncbi:hypothetical protein LCGC14_1506440 [marine sediment metagenome]|uniref:Uncharacterized protein n=1 Tax=marine sediment metagenome TaxID=412755 RepID=A0A0F9J309_9ZZZZ
MEKLKTLKDIARCPTCYTMEDEKCILYLTLKQEAIKWVKEDIKLWEPELGEGIIGPDQWRWMNRFNITEEDLK